MPFFINIPVLSANSVHSDQTSDMDLQCLPMSFYRTLCINALRSFHSYEIQAYERSQYIVMTQRLTKYNGNIYVAYFEG